MALTTRPTPLQSIILRGGRLAKRGRTAVSFAPVIGLVGAAAIFGASGAMAQEVSGACGPLALAGGTVTCDVDTYTPEIDGDGTEEKPGTTAINYDGVFSNEVTLEIKALEIALNQRNRAVFINVRDTSTNTRSVINLDGENNIKPFGTFRSAVDITDASSTAVSSTINISAGSALETNARGSNVVRVAQTASGNAGNINIALNGDVSVISSGITSNGVYALKQGASASGKIDIDILSDVKITTFGNDSNGVVALLNSIDSGDIVTDILVSGTQITTSGVKAHGVFSYGLGSLTNSKVNSTITINGDTIINLFGEFSAGAYSLFQGDEIFGDTQISLADTASLIASADSSRGINSIVSGDATNLNSSVEVGGDNKIILSGNDVIGVQSVNLGAGNIEISSAGEIRVNVDAEGNELTPTADGEKVAYKGATGIRTDHRGLALVNEDGSLQTDPETDEVRGAAETIINLGGTSRISVAGDNGVGVLATTVARVETISPTGDITINADGAITVTGNAVDSAAGADDGQAGGIIARHAGTAGDVAVTTTAAVTVTGDGAIGVGVDVADSTSTGATSVEVKASTVDGVTGGVFVTGDNTVAVGTDNAGLGGSVVTVAEGGSVTATGDGAIAARVALTNAANGAGVTVTVDGTLLADAGENGSDAVGVESTNAGSGASTVAVAEGGVINAKGTDATGVSATSDVTGTGAVTLSVAAGGDVTATGAGAVAAAVSIENAANTNALTVDVAGDLVATGTGAVGIDAENKGTGLTSLTSTGDIAVTGENAIGIDLDVDGAFALNIAEGSVTGGTGATGAAVRIAGGKDATGTVTIAHGVTIGGAADTQAIAASGDVIANVVNRGVILGGVDVTGNLEIVEGASLTVAGAQNIKVGGDLVQNGTLSTADGDVNGTITIAGDLSGNGTFNLDADTTGGESKVERLNVGGDIVAGSAVKVELATKGEVNAGSTDLIRSALNVEGTVGEGAQVSVQAGIIVFNATGGADGKLEVAQGEANADGQLVSAAPTAVASGLVRLVSTNARLSNRAGNVNGNGTTAEVGQSAFEPLGSMTERAASMQSGVYAATTFDWLKSTQSTGSLTNDSYGELEVGYDAVMGSGNGTLVLSAGVFFGSLSSEIQTDGGNSAVSSETLGLGLNATYFSQGGTYVDLGGRIAQAESDFTAAGGQADGIDSESYTVAAEIGHRIALSPTASITPSVQVTYGEIDTDAFTLNGVSVDASTTERKLARIGGTYENAIASMGTSSYQFSANYLRDFSDASEVTASGVTLASEGERDWFELGAGSQLDIGGGNSLSFDVSYRVAKDNAADNSGLSASIGFQRQW